MPIKQPDKGATPLKKVIGLGKIVAGAYTGNVSMIGAGASDINPKSGIGKVGSIVGQNQSTGGGAPGTSSEPEGSRGAGGEANLGVKTDLGYGKQQPQGLQSGGAFQRRVSAPSLGAKTDLGYGGYSGSPMSRRYGGYEY